MRFVNTLLATSIMLSAGLALATTESEPNDARAAADAAGSLPATLQGGLPGSYGNGVTDDYWSFSTNAGDQVTVTANPVNASGIAPIDLGFEIQDAGGSQLAIVDDNGDNVSETHTFTASGGTYYVVMYEATGTINAIASYSTTIAATPSSVEDWDLY